MIFVDFVRVPFVRKGDGFLIRAVQTSIAWTRHTTSTELNHPHLPCIALQWRKSHYMYLHFTFSIDECALLSLLWLIIISNLLDYAASNARFVFFCFCFRQLNQFRHSPIVPEYIEYAGLNRPYSLPVPFVRTKVSKVSLSVIFPQNCYGTGNLVYPSPITDILMHSNLWTISNIFSWPGKKMYWKL